MIAFKKLIEEMYKRREKLKERYGNDRGKPAFNIKKEFKERIPKIKLLITNIREFYNQVWRQGLNKITDQREREEPERRLNVILLSLKSITEESNKLTDLLGYYSLFVWDDAMKRKKDELLKVCDNIIGFCDKIAESAQHLESKFPDLRTQLRSIQGESAEIIKIFEKKGIFG